MLVRPLRNKDGSPGKLDSDHMQINPLSKKQQIESLTIKVPFFIYGVSQSK